METCQVLAVHFLLSRNFKSQGCSLVTYYSFVIVENCTATCLLSRKLSKLDEPDMQDTAGEAGTNS